jgi:hypothetical protein
MTGDNPITEFLAAPLSPDWTVEGLAEQVLDTIAMQHCEKAQEYVLDIDATVDRQTRRILRPLLACLAAKAEAETGNPVSIYGGRLVFKRSGPLGPVWIVGQFENVPAKAYAAFRCEFTPPLHCISQPPLSEGALPTPADLRGSKTGMRCVCCGCRLIESTCIVPGCGRTFYVCAPDKPGDPSCSAGNDGRCPACRRGKVPVPQPSATRRSETARFPKCV